MQTQTTSSVTRGDVYARLHACANDGTANAFGTLKEEILGLPREKTYRDVFRELASLVYRPSCESTSGLLNLFECSCCGACLELTDEQGCPTLTKAGDRLVVRFCPGCGAKIIDS